MRIHLTDYGLRLGPQDEALAPYLQSLLTAFDATTPVVQPKPVTSPAPRHPPPVPLIEPLSERELEVLRLLDSGLSNQAIADELIVALSTVKKHLINIYGKLGVNSRTQALTYARSLGLL